MAILYKEKKQKLGHLQQSAQFLDMTVQCKDVGICLRYAFSMGTLVWKASHILKKC